MNKDIDILNAEIIILEAREEYLMLELEEIRTSIGYYQNAVDDAEE